MAPNAAEKVSKGIAISLGKDFGLCCMQLQPDGAASLHTAHTHTHPCQAAAATGNATLAARGTTIFEVMSSLAREHNSVNLGQG